MKRLLIPLAAAAALAVPAGALAWGGHLGVFAKLSGTGTSFGTSSATSSGSIVAGHLLGSGTYSASLSSDWAHATTHTFDKGTVSCAPATGKLSLGSGTQTTSLALTGKTCSFTPAGGSAKYAFFGRGGTDHVFFKEDSTGTVHGIVFGGFHR